MRVYITKYALTKGIKAEDANPSAGSDMVTVSRTYGRDCYWTPHWHTTPEAALARAEKMRSAKIAALKKQIAKLEQMTFRVDSA